LRNASTVWRQVATADGPQVPGTDSEGDLLAILAGADGAWHRFGGRFASDPGRGRWCLASIPEGDLLAILAGAIGAWHRFQGGDLLAILAGRTGAWGALVPGTDSEGDLLAILAGAIGAWHRFRRVIC
jgi:uncharacterized membrane protein YeaQ/YmgE (transglycosylase-associated protein family)